MITWISDQTRPQIITECKQGQEELLPALDKFIYLRDLNNSEFDKVVFAKESELKQLY